MNKPRTLATMLAITTISFFLAHTTDAIYKNITLPKIERKLKKDFLQQLEEEGKEGLREHKDDICDFFEDNQKGSFQSHINAGEDDLIVTLENGEKVILNTDGLSVSFDMSQDSTRTIRIEDGDTTKVKTESNDNIFETKSN